MHTYPAAALLDDLQQQTETMLRTAISDWQMAPPSRFSAPARDGGWSAAQCISHLNGYGAYYLPLIREALSVARPVDKGTNTFTPGWLGDYFTRIMAPERDGTAKKKMKAFKQHVPPAGEDSDGVIALFIEQQEALLQLLEAARGLDMGRRKVPVSILPLIRLKTGDVFRFLIAHNQRHVAQAARALAVPATQPA